MLPNRTHFAFASRCLAIIGCATFLLARSPAALGQAAPTPPTVGIAFAPASIASGGTSQLRITLGNANGAAATLTQTLVDSLPAGMTIATAGAAGSCTTAAVGAQAGSGAVTYATQAAIPAGGCTITVNVT